MRSSDDAAGGGKATVCAAAGRHQHAAHVPVNSVSKKSSFERTAFATPGGFFPAGLKHTAAVDHGADRGVPRVAREGQGRGPCRMVWSQRQSAALARTAGAEMPSRPDQLFYRHVLRSRSGLLLMDT